MKIKKILASVLGLALTASVLAGAAQATAALLNPAAADLALVLQAETSLK